MSSFIRSLREIFFFSLPIIAGQLGQMLFGFGDIIVAGHYSTSVLSALGIATAIISPFLIIGLGITYVISPTQAKRLAENRSITHFAGTSLLLALIAGSVLSLLILILTLNLEVIGFEPEIQMLVGRYLMICGVSVIPALVFQAIKENLQAHEKTIFANALIFAFNGFNIAANVFFMFSCELGIAGAALATTLSRTLMAITLYWYASRVLDFKLRVSWNLLVSLFKKGLPVGFGGLVTALVFSLVTILAGRMSVVASAANNIIMNISSLTYMIPYALASACSVKIGKEYGKRNIAGIRWYGLATIFLGVVTALFMALLFFLIPESILAVASGDKEVIHYGVIILFYVALYQIPDAIQCILQGCLRGMGITFKPMVYGFLGFWTIGVPAGCYLAFVKGMEAAGLWAGLAVGLAAIAILFGYLFLDQLKRHLPQAIGYSMREEAPSISISY